MGLVVLLEDGLVGVWHAVGHQHDGLVSLSPDLKYDKNQISGCPGPGECDCLKGNLISLPGVENVREGKFRICFKNGRGEEGDVGASIKTSNLSNL